jgi:hypothetical protein
MKVKRDKQDIDLVEQVKRLGPLLRLEAFGFEGDLFNLYD